MHLHLYDLKKWLQSDSKLVWQTANTAHVNRQPPLTQATRNTKNAHSQQPSAIKKARRNSWMDYTISQIYIFFFSHGQQTKHLLVIGCRALHTHRDGHHCVIEKTVPKRQEQCATNTTRNDITQERIALNYCHGTHHLYTLHFPQTTTQKWTNVRHDAKKRAIFFFSATLGHLCEQNKQVL